MSATRRPEPVAVSKIEAARRQLETAISLYFHEGDLVSMHTLGCAAHGIIEGLNKGAGGEPTLKETLKTGVRPEFAEEFAQKLHEAQNFFKHARSGEASKVVKLGPYHTQIILLDACWTYRRLTGERLPMLTTYEVWAFLTWGSDFIEYPNIDRSTRVHSEWAAMTRGQFFSDYLPLAHTAIAVGKTAPRP